MQKHPCPENKAELVFSTKLCDERKKVFGDCRKKFNAYIYKA